MDEDEVPINTSEIMGNLKKNFSKMKENFMQKYSEKKEMFGDYVSENPIKSVMISVCIGIVVGKMMRGGNKECW